MGKSKTWTIKRIAFWTLIVAVIAVLVAVLQYFKKTESGITVHSKSGVTVVGNNANLTVDQRTGVDANVYGAEVEKRVIAETQVKQYKEEMRDIEATKHDDLMKRYALGYILFYIDHPRMVIPYESRIKVDCSLDISEAKVIGVSNDAIGIELPNIECKPGPIIMECTYGIKREVGKQVPVFGRFPQGIQMYLEMLVDHGDSFVCVLGFADVSSRK